MNKLIIFNPLKIGNDKVLSGRDIGHIYRLVHNLDELDRTEEKVIITLPSNLMAITASFFIGCFGPSVKKLGALGFSSKYKFDTDNPSVLEHIKLGIKTCSLIHI